MNAPWYDLHFDPEWRDTALSPSEGQIEMRQASLIEQHTGPLFFAVICSESTGPPFSHDPEPP